MAASGNVPVGPFNLTDASIKLAVAHYSGDIVRVDRGEAVTPIFQLAGIHWKWWPFKREGRLEKAITDSPAVDLTPELARSDPRVADALYLDLVR